MPLALDEEWKFLIKLISQKQFRHFGSSLQAQKEKFWKAFSLVERKVSEDLCLLHQSIKSLRRRETLKCFNWTGESWSSRPQVLRRDFSIAEGNETIELLGEDTCFYLGNTMLHGNYISYVFKQLNILWKKYVQWATVHWIWKISNCNWYNITN